MTPLRLILGALWFIAAMFAVVAIIILFDNCAGSASYIRAGEPCHADSCEVIP